MKKVITVILVIFMFTVNITYADDTKKIELQFRKEISKTSINSLIDKIRNRKIRNALRPVKGYLGKYYKLGIYTIISHESGNFKWNTGIYDKHDIGYCQVSRRYWSIKKINEKFKLSKRLKSWKQFKSDIKLQVEVCSLVWLYNIGIYRLKTGKYPTNMLDFITLYHSFEFRKRRHYRKKVAYKFWYFYKKKLFNF